MISWIPSLLIFCETAKKCREDPYGVNIHHEEDGRSLSGKHSPDGTERPVHSGLEKIAKNIGYQPSQEQNLCPCYPTFVTQPAATWKILMYQEKDTNQNRDEQ